MKQIVKITHNYGTYGVFCSTGITPWFYPYWLYRIEGKKKWYIKEYDSLTDATLECLAYAMTGGI